MTHEITIETGARLNPALLAEELQTALGEALRGVLTEPGRVRVVLVAPPTTAQVELVRTTLATHNPSDESSIQREARLRRARLIALRAGDVSLQPEDFAGEPALIRQLARKVMVLEARLEVMARGLRDNS